MRTLNINFFIQTPKRTPCRVSDLVHNWGNYMFKLLLQSNIHILFACFCYLISDVLSLNFAQTETYAANRFLLSCFKNLPHSSDFKLAPFLANSVRNRELSGSNSHLKNPTLGMKWQRETAAIFQQT